MKLISFYRDPHSPDSVPAADGVAEVLFTEGKLPMTPRSVRQGD
ncbi:hypothetical protein V2O64_14845 [Verrucomicrobiaceae bacterium 227]